MSENTKESTSNITEVDISPEISMYNLMESFPYDLGNALSEYVDNSIQSFLENKEILKKEKLQVKITIDYSNKHNNKIIIEDDGIGISNTDLQRAMKPAFKPDEQSLSEFGIGMKAASVWIGRKWTLSNNYLFRENIDKTEKIVFDLDELIKNNQGSIPIITIPNKINKNGVIITIEKLNRTFDKEQIEDAFLTLEENYQYFINTTKILDLHLISTEYNDLETITKDEVSTPNVLKSRKMILKSSKPCWNGEKIKEWKQEVSFIFNDKPVTGFVMCREPSAQKNPGLKYFREKRLIQGTCRKPNRPIYLLKTPNKHDSLRFYAELHLDGQKISNNKDMLDINEKQFLDILKAQEGVEEILEQAKNYRPRAVENNTVKECNEENSKKTNSSEYKSNSSNTNETSKNTTKPKQASSTDILNLVIANTKDLITKHIALEAVTLYNNQRQWGFVLCYRVIAEKVIQEKIKNMLPIKYNSDKVANKGIVDLVKWLSNNKKFLNLNQEWKSLDKTLDQISGSNKFNFTNLVGHGHYIPTKEEVDTLVANTQKLLEWAVSQE